MLVFAGMVYTVPANVISALTPDSGGSKSQVDTTIFSDVVFEADSLLSHPPDTVPVPNTDSLQNKDTVTSVIPENTVPVPEIPYLFFSDVTYRKLQRFFKKAASARKDGKTVRVLHMGDSQIEGDRITRFIRESLQERYGGTGPGIFTVYDPQKLNPSIWLDNYGDWNIYRIFDRKNKLRDNGYGIMGVVAKFKPGTPSGFRFRPSPWAEKKAKKYYKVRLFLGEVRDTIFLTGYTSNSEIIDDTLYRSKGITEINWEFEDNVPKLKLMFSSASSPVFLGCALDSLAGIAVDNIALRGQYTPWFHRTNRDLFKTMVSYLDVGLIILQFGTNIIPTNSEDFRFYRIKMERQLRILKKLAPDCPVILVGTADAAYFKDGKEVSYEHLPELNKAQKAAALNTGAAFFDLYNAMGGKGSIIEWVHSNPPLAIKDYIHFTREGGEIVADMMLKSLYEIVDAGRESVDPEMNKDTLLNEVKGKADTTQEISKPK